MGKHSRIEIINNWVSENNCDNIVNNLKSIDKSTWIDRNKSIPNYGVNGEVGKYFSITSVTHPNLDVIKDLNKFAPNVQGAVGPYEVQETIINYYSPKHYVPPHCDTVRDVFAIAMVMLGETDKCFHYYPDGVKGNKETIPDKKGRVVILHDIGMIHEVSPVSVERYSLIYNYH